MGFDIGARHVGDGAPCYVIAEVGLAHDGSLGMAHAYIDAAAQAGVDAVKFQCHLGDPVSEWRVEPRWPQDKDRQAYWERTHFTQEQWWSLKAHCDEKGVEFLCSPFSVQAVRMLDPLVRAWKVPSGQIRNWELMGAIRRTRKPIIASVGMGGLPIYSDATLFCRSLYPCPPEKIGLGLVIDGLSDHSGAIWPSIAAVALGASIVEVHICWSKQQHGFDTSSSITVEDLGRLVEGIRFVEKALQPVDKDQLAKELEPMRRLFMPEVVQTEDNWAKREAARIMPVLAAGVRHGLEEGE